MSALTSEPDLATEWGIPAEKLASLRQKHKWDHVRLDRFTVLYTEQQVAAIIRSRTVGGVHIAGGRTPRPARKAAS